MIMHAKTSSSHQTFSLRFLPVSVRMDGTRASTPIIGLTFASTQGLIDLTNLGHLPRISARAANDEIKAHRSYFQVNPGETQVDITSQRWWKQWCVNHARSQAICSKKVFKAEVMRVADEWDHNKHFDTVDLVLTYEDESQARFHPNQQNPKKVSFGVFAGNRANWIEEGEQERLREMERAIESLAPTQSADDMEILNLLRAQQPPPPPQSSSSSGYANFESLAPTQSANSSCEGGPGDFGAQQPPPPLPGAPQFRQALPIPDTLPKAPPPLQPMSIDEMYDWTMYIHEGRRWWHQDNTGRHTFDVPPGWVEGTDPESGRTWAFSERTNQFHWTS